jgi:glucose/arabinose dehydrogenase
MCNEISDISTARRAFKLAIYFSLFGAFSAAPFLILPGIFSNTPVASLDTTGLVVIATLCVAYATICAILTIAVFLNVRFRTSVIVLSGSIAYGVPLYVTILYQNPDLYLLVLYTIFVSLIFLGLFFAGFKYSRATVVSMAIFSIMAIASGDLQQISRRVTKNLDTTSVLRTAFYNLKADVYVKGVPHSIPGGAIERYSDHYLLATGDGRLYTFESDRNVDDGLHLSLMPIRVPINFEEFSDTIDDPVVANRFKVADVLVRETGSNIDIFASHHFWRRDRQCYVLRVSLISGTADSLAQADPGSGWKTIFETTPCLSIDERAPYFRGEEAGGRMAMRSDSELVLTVGDHVFDGLHTDTMHAQNMASSYGKTLVINLDTRDHKILSAGHRNPQGLYIDLDGNIWLTEHGPQGGDELNLIEEGANYGWPLVTYGTAYGMQKWSLSEQQGKHSGFERPIYSWVPSIGISNLLGIESNHFPLWQSDLLVSSLVSRSLYRLRLREGRVVFTEPIYVEKRIRDIVEGHAGEIILWVDDESTIIILDHVTDNDDGAALYSMCIGCHMIDRGDAHGIGPNLRGVVGRRPGTASGYGYSEALKDLDSRWTRDLLDDFLSNPNQVAPGTSMVFPGITDELTRQKIIDYLIDN